MGGVGLLFEIWIVDASIFVVCCRQRPYARPGCTASELLVGLGGGVCWVGVGALAVPVIGVWCGVVLVVASCEGHMVDALASRADEGRRSLR